MTTRKPSPTALVASLALFFSLGGGAYAATHYRITSMHQLGPGVRHELRGKVGPMGPQGPQGRSGTITVVAKTASTPPVQGLAFATASMLGTPVTIPAGGQGTATATCQANAGLPNAGLPTGGGYIAAPGLVVNTDEQDAAPKFNGWNVTATNPTEQSLTLQAQVVCAQPGD